MQRKLVGLHSLLGHQLLQRTRSLILRKNSVLAGHHTGRRQKRVHGNRGSILFQYKRSTTSATTVTPACHSASDVSRTNPDDNRNLAEMVTFKKIETELPHGQQRGNGPKKAAVDVKKMQYREAAGTDRNSNAVFLRRTFLKPEPNNRRRPETQPSFAPTGPLEGCGVLALEKNYAEQRPSHPL